MSELDQVAMGRLIEAVDTLKDEVEKLRGDVAALNVSVANIQGGWKAVAGFSAAAVQRETIQPRRGSSFKQITELPQLTF